MRHHPHALCGAAAALFVSQTAVAGPADYVYTPVVVQGEREIDFKTGAQRAQGQPVAAAISLGVGYGVAARWFTELYAKFKRGDGEDMHYDAIEWENKFQFTETGEYAIDSGFLLEIERPAERAEGWEVKWGPLFQTQFDRVQINANLLFESHVGAETAAETESMYQWQAKLLWHPSLDVGMQGFGEMGEWNAWNPARLQTHRAGPAIFGKLPLGGHHAVEYNAALTFGLNSASPAIAPRVQIEYEF